MRLFLIISNYIVISRLMTIWLFCVRWFCAKLCIKANGFVQRMGPDWFIKGTGQHGVLNSQPRHFTLNISLSEQFSTILHQPSHSWIHSRFCSADVLPPWHISWTNLTFSFIWKSNCPPNILIAYWRFHTAYINLIHGYTTAQSC